MDLSAADSNDYLHSDRSLQFKRERRKARKVIVERLRRERIDRCLDQLKHWLQDSTLASQSQAENCNLEKADILELTVSQLRRMVANTQLQSVYGYSACVNEVNDFLSGIRYDDATRRRIVQHLCRRRPSLVPAPPDALARRRVPADVESTSGDAEPLRMFSYSSADSTTDGATEPCEAGTAATAVVNGDAGTGCVPEVEETANSAVCSERKVPHSVESTDDAVPVVIGVHETVAAADDSGSNLQDDAVLTPVWRPW